MAKFFIPKTACHNNEILLKNICLGFYGRIENANMIIKIKGKYSDRNKLLRSHTILIRAEDAIIKPKVLDLGKQFQTQEHFNF